MKTCYISNLRDGDLIDDVFLICSKSFSMTQNGAQYARIRLADRSGQIEAMHWDAGDSAYAGIAVDDYVQVRGQVSMYRDKLQIRIDSLRKYNDNVDPADFLPVCPKDRIKLRQELMKKVESVEHPHLRKLLSMFFDDEKFVEVFCAAPAASKVHHAYIGGLLEHAVSVAELCDVICGCRPEINRDLLITGALLHDMGKTEELSWSRSIKYTDNGQLLGHIMIGASMVEHAAEKIADFHPMLKMLLVHMILSHHGETEYGSPKRPKCLEALVLHFVDDIDAKINSFQQAVSSIENNGSWTERNWVFDRPLFKGLPNTIISQLTVSTAEEEKAGGDGEEFDPFDFNLFSDNG